MAAVSTRSGICSRRAGGSSDSAFLSMNSPGSFLIGGTDDGSSFPVVVRIPCSRRVAAIPATAPRACVGGVGGSEGAWTYHITCQQAPSGSRRWQDTARRRGERTRGSFLSPLASTRSPDPTQKYLNFVVAPGGWLTRRRGGRGASACFSA